MSIWLRLLLFFSRRCVSKTVLSPDCPQGGRLELFLFGAVVEKSGEEGGQLQHCPPPAHRHPGHRLGRRPAFVAAPGLVLGAAGTRAVDCHFPYAGTRLGRRAGVSLSVAGRGGTIRALGGGGVVVGRRRAGLRGRSGGLGGGGGGTVDFVALGVALRRRAGVDAVRVALRGRLGRPPALPSGLDQVLQGDGTSLPK